MPELAKAFQSSDWRDIDLGAAFSRFLVAPSPAFLAAEGARSHGRSRGRSGSR
jgi:hypothetical protein